MAEKGVELDKKNITVEPFKTLGTYTAEVRLHKHVRGTINFTVEPEGALVAEEKDPNAPAKKEKKTKVEEATPVVAPEAVVEIVEAAPEAVPETPAAE